VVAGVQVGFEQMIVPHLDAAYTLARYLLRDGEDARDAVQDASLRAIKYVATFRGDDPRAWFMAIVRNTCHTRLTRRQRSDLTTAFDEEAHTPTDDAGEDLPPALHHIPPTSVRDAVDGLPIEFRETIILREIHGYSYSEIATVVGVPVGTVMSRLARARQRLRDALGPRAGEGARS
jgi:RNA polymerase sigma-70 factor (ECF subfamily)